MGSGVKKLREQVDRLPLDSALKAAVLDGVDQTDDETAAREATALGSLIARIPTKLAAIRASVAQDERAQSRPVKVARVEREAEPATPTHDPHPVRGSRTYEVLFIMSPRIEEEQATALIADLKAIAERNGAQLKSQEPWGRRRLAYPISSFHEGVYHLFVFESGSHLSELDRRMKNTELILRHMIVRTDLDHKRADKLAKRNPKKERTRREEPPERASRHDEPAERVSSPADPKPWEADDARVH